jgi:Rieske Fe-S protein
MVSEISRRTFLEAAAAAGLGAVVLGGCAQGIAVIRTGDTTATALSAVCTHEACTVEIQSGSPPLFCPCHGSEFALSGAVVRGPARQSLRVYQASVDANGVTVTLA